VQTDIVSFRHQNIGNSLDQNSARDLAANQLAPGDRVIDAMCGYRLNDFDFNSD